MKSVDDRQPLNLRVLSVLQFMCMSALRVPRLIFMYSHVKMVAIVA